MVFIFYVTSVDLELSSCIFTSPTLIGKIDSGWLLIYSIEVALIRKFHLIYMKRTTYPVTKSYAILGPIMKKGALLYIFDKNIDGLTIDEVQELVMQGFYNNIF